MARLKSIYRHLFAVMTVSRHPLSVRIRSGKICNLNSRQHRLHISDFTCANDTQQLSSAYDDSNASYKIVSSPASVPTSSFKCIESLPLLLPSMPGGVLTTTIGRPHQSRSRPDECTAVGAGFSASVLADSWRPSAVVFTMPALSLCAKW